jgi:hypothetical protein
MYHNLSNKMLKCKQRQFPSSYLLRLLTMALFRGVNRRPSRLSSISPWWWLAGVGPAGEALLNKRLLLQSIGDLLLLPLSLSGLGGVNEIWRTTVFSCWIEAVRGHNLVSLVFKARGSTASANSCWNGGITATSVEEAFFSSAAEARRRFATKWSCPRWLNAGRWQNISAGREPTSYLLLFLGGNAWRTPASRGRDTQALHCFDRLFCRVFFVKCKPLPSNIRFLVRVLYKGLSAKLCTCHFYNRKSGVF